MRGVFIFFLCSRKFERWSLTHSTAMKFSSKFLRNWRLFPQNQQPLNIVKPFEGIGTNCLRTRRSPVRKEIEAFSIRVAVFKEFSRDFQRFRFFFPRSACFSKLAPPRNLQSWVKSMLFRKEFRKEFCIAEFIAVEGVIIVAVIFLLFFLWFWKPNSITCDSRDCPVMTVPGVDRQQVLGNEPTPVNAVPTSIVLCLCFRGK